MNAIQLYRFARKLYLFKIPALPQLIQSLIFFLYNSYVPYTCIIGKGTKFGYKGMGVVIHARSVIGEDCIISQQVTIGGRSKKENVPVIGDHVYIGAGAKILGDITIGNHVVIGANAVVIHNVDNSTVVAGVPARVIHENINIEDYFE